jgi:Tol biopolymer transport system component
MQIWRMPASGGAAQQITSDEFNNWYPHLSPDGRRILMLSCDKSVKSPPEDREVLLRVLTLETTRFQVVARILTGGRGTIDSPSWSPDGRRIAFVTYQFMPAQGPLRQ